MQTAFEDYMDGQARELGGDWFDGKLVGVSHANDGGRHRQDILLELQERDELDLRPEPENPFDKNAVAVFTSSGDQAGYLDKRLAGEVTRRLAKGVRYRCFVRAVREGRDVRGLSFALAASKLPPAA